MELREQGSQELPVEGKKTVEMDLVLPEADIGGLHFNATAVHAVFDLREDGWYHSRDILGFSARNDVNVHNRDILTEYLNSSGSDSIKGQVMSFLDQVPVDIEISLPKTFEGLKKYNGVHCGYWLEPKYDFDEHDFTSFYWAGTDAVRYAENASDVYGYTFNFRIGQEVTK
jgi:hypothetical protein